ncbi:MAG: UTP--glucose-1-phosphate uridylyltransferase [Candidatus Poriferisodalaceae bacterium]
MPIRSLVGPSDPSPTSPLLVPPMVIASHTRSQLAHRYDIDDASAEILERFGFDADCFDALTARMASAASKSANNASSANIVTGVLEPMRPTDIARQPASSSAEYQRLAAMGTDAIASGQVGVVLLAGGMATRFGVGVKALAEVLPGARFLDVKVRDLQYRAASVRCPIELVLMTSFQSDALLADAAVELSSDMVKISTIPQGVSMRLTPTGDIHRDAEGMPSLYAPGHGDLPDTLRNSGFVEGFIARGGRHIFVTNVDNAAATLDPVIVGLHIASGNRVTCEVTPSHSASGGAPYVLDGHAQIIEDFRIPRDFDRSLTTAVNTNSLTIDVASLREPAPLSWFSVEKEVDGAQVVQFERLVGELSAFLPTTMLLVEGDGPDGRFQPVKTPEELERRRPTIRAILGARGIL